MAKDTKFDSAKIMKDIKSDKRIMAVVGGALALLVGMFLPWVTVDLGDAGGILGSSFNRSLNGLDANSFLPIVLLAVATTLVLNLANQTKKNTYLGATIVSALAFIIVLIDWPSTGGTLGTVSVGIGYYLSFIGSAAMTVGSGLLLKATMDGEKNSPAKKEKNSAK